MKSIINILELLDKMKEMYSAESWKKFYKPKLECFFFKYKGGAPIESITSFNVDKFLNTFEPNSPRQLNYYNALNSFYSFAYEQTQNPYMLQVMKDIVKPVVIRKVPKYICDEDILSLQKFVQNPQNKLYDRLLLGLILYTGLPRRYIFDLQNGNIKPDSNFRYAIWITDENGEHKIPISKKLEGVVKEYDNITKDLSPYSKVFNYSQDTSISVRVTTLTKNITGHAYSPNVLGNTFIKMALTYNPDVYSIGRIALKSVSTIEKYLTLNIDSEIFDRQTKIVDNI